MKNEYKYEQHIRSILSKYSTNDAYYEYLRSDYWDYAVRDIEQFYHENNNINRIKVKLKRFWNKLISKLLIK